MEGGDFFIVYTDGGARNTPGPAAIGYVIQDPKGRTLKEHGETIGETTNNVAEYKAVIAALKKLKSLIGGERAKQSRIEVRSDSELIVRQLNAEYKIKESELVPLFVAIWNARQDFGEIAFVHVRREQNRAADYLVNQALDAPTALFG